MRFEVSMRIILTLLILFSFYAQAQSSCSATNTNGDQNCSINCPVGQAAICQNATGSSTPTCSCSAQLPSPSKIDINPVKKLPIVVAKLECVSLVLGNGSARLVNSCDRCMIAQFSDSNAGIKNFRIPAYGFVDIHLSGTLVSDRQC